MNAGFGMPPLSKGVLNDTFTEEIRKFFEAKNYEIKVTNMKEGYTVEEEVNKIVWADIIIVQAPTWMLGLPYKAKEYIDHVLLAYGVCPGKCPGKKVMISATFGSTEASLHDPNSAYQGLGAEPAWWNLYQNFAYAGITKLPLFYVTNTTEPDFNFEESVNKLRAHLNNVFQ